LSESAVRKTLSSALTQQKSIESISNTSQTQNWLDIKASFMFGVVELNEPPNHALRRTAATGLVARA
jgi:hypothetical protein